MLTALLCVPIGSGLLAAAAPRRAVGWVASAGSLATLVLAIVLLAGFDPNAVVAFGPADEVPLLEGKTLVEGRPAVYVCERFACQRPVTNAAELQPA